MVDDLSRAFDKVQTSDCCRVVIIRSAYETFCEGMDLRLAAKSPEEGGEKDSNAIQQYARLLRAMRLLPKPIVCVVRGSVKAGGVGIVAASDIVCATTGATFELSETLFGIIPANVIPYILGARIPPSKLLWLTMTARRIAAEDAQRINLIDEIYPDDRLEKGVRALCKRLLRSAPHALSALKQFVHDATRPMRQEALERSEGLTDKMLAMPETVAGISSFVEGSTPQWFFSYRPNTTLSVPDGAC